MAGATYACARTICTAGVCTAGFWAAAGAWLPRNIPSSTMNRLYITRFLFSNSWSSSLKRRNSPPSASKSLLVLPERLRMRGRTSLRVERDCWERSEFTRVAVRLSLLLCTQSVGFGSHGDIHMSAFFELYVIAVFIRQGVFNSEISISLIGSVDSNLRLFRLAHVPRRNYLVYNPGHRRAWLFWTS